MNLKHFGGTAPCRYEAGECVYCGDKMTKLYDNAEGFSVEANRITDDFRRVARRVFEDYPETDLLALAGLLHGAIEEARCEVSLDRRMPLQDSLEIIRPEGE